LRFAVTGPGAVQDKQDRWLVARVEATLPLGRFRLRESVRAAFSCLETFCGGYCQRNQWCGYEF
jgi:hypothetical protein